MHEKGGGSLSQQESDPSHHSRTLQHILLLMPKRKVFQVYNPQSTIKVFIILFE